jgi:hypothetical protein
MEKTVLLISFFIVTILNSCEKKEDPPKPTGSLYMSEELKSYYFFPKGSWWVYKRIDTTAEIYDTATVVHSESEMVFNELLPYEWEEVAVNIEHTYYPSTPRSVSPYLNVFIRNDGGFVDRISMTSQGQLFKYLPYFFSVPIDSTSMEKKSHVPDSPILIDTNDISINNLYFNKVIHIEHGSTELKYKLWIAKGVGIIKFHNTGDKTNWELINYEIKN